VSPPRAGRDAADGGRETLPGTGPGTGRRPFPGLLTTWDQRAVMRSFVENGRGKATFTGR
jgi:enoyl-CoA hydratase